MVTNKAKTVRCSKIEKFSKYPKKRFSSFLSFLKILKCIPIDLNTLIPNPFTDLGGPTPEKSYSPPPRFPIHLGLPKPKPKPKPKPNEGGPTEKICKTYSVEKF